jgi:hypothetical protein
METQKVVNDDSFSLLKNARTYFVVFGSIFLVATLLLGFSIGSIYYYYSYDGLVLLGMVYAVIGLLCGGLCSVSILIRSSAFFALCNLFRFLVVFIVVFVFWVFFFLI